METSLWKSGFSFMGGCLLRLQVGYLYLTDVPRLQQLVTYLLQPGVRQQWAVAQERKQPGRGSGAAAGKKLPRGTGGRSGRGGRGSAAKGPERGQMNK
jgi:hypothetical protein